MTSKIHPLSAPNWCFHNASNWTHPKSKDGALHIFSDIAPGKQDPRFFESPLVSHHHMTILLAVGSIMYVTYQPRQSLAPGPIP